MRTSAWPVNVLAVTSSAQRPHPVTGLAASALSRAGCGHPYENGAAMRLVLRTETLTELTPSDLTGVRGGGVSFDNCLTWICWPLVNAVVHATTQAATGLTVATCAG
jgi:hypothetical protein